MRKKIVIVITLISLTMTGVILGGFAWIFGIEGKVLFTGVFLSVESMLLIGVLERRAPLFGRVIWKSSTREPVIALTFDDGPNEPYTSKILDILKENGIKATFFVLGKNAERYPETVRREASEGHEIGNHTWDHEVLPLKSPHYIRDQIRRTSALICRYAGKPPRLFRAPHGWRNPWVNPVAKQEGCIPVAWSLGVWDTDRPGMEKIVLRTIKGLKNGCCVLLHDGRGVEEHPDAGQLVEALPIIIETARQKGYRFKTFSELIGLEDS